MAPRKCHVLVVDDDESFREVLVTYLVERGFEVTGAASGVEALARVAVERPSVVIADLRMPGMGGQQLCEELARGFDPAPSVVLLSGDSRGGERVGTLVQRFLRKPVDLDVLVAALDELCDRDGAA